MMMVAFSFFLLEVPSFSLFSYREIEFNQKSRHKFVKSMLHKICRCLMVAFSFPRLNANMN